eukprot:gene3470-658_t
MSIRDEALYVVESLVDTLSQDSQELQQRDPSRFYHILAAPAPTPDSRNVRSPCPAYHALSDTGRVRRALIPSLAERMDDLAKKKDGRLLFTNYEHVGGKALKFFCALLCFKSFSWADEGILHDMGLEALRDREVRRWAWSLGVKKLSDGNNSCMQGEGAGQEKTPSDWMKMIFGLLMAHYDPEDAAALAQRYICGRLVEEGWESHTRRETQKLEHVHEHLARSVYLFEKITTELKDNAVRASIGLVLVNDELASVGDDLSEAMVRKQMEGSNSTARCRLQLLILYEGSSAPSTIQALCVQVHWPLEESKASGPADEFRHLHLSSFVHSPAILAAQKVAKCQRLWVQPYQSPGERIGLVCILPKEENTSDIQSDLQKLIPALEERLAKLLANDFYNASVKIAMKQDRGEIPDCLWSCTLFCKDKNKESAQHTLKHKMMLPLLCKLTFPQVSWHETECHADGGGWQYLHVPEQCASGSQELPASVIFQREQKLAPGAIDLELLYQMSLVAAEKSSKGGKSTPRSITKNICSGDPIPNYSPLGQICKEVAKVTRAESSTMIGQLIANRLSKNEQLQLYTNIDAARVLAVVLCTDVLSKFQIVCGTEELPEDTAQASGISADTFPDERHASIFRNRNVKPELVNLDDRKTLRDHAEKCGMKELLAKDLQDG